MASEGRNDDELAFLEGAIGQFPSDADVRLRYAVVLVASRPTLARREALRALELDRSGDPIRLAKAARVLVATRDLDGARRCVKRATDTQPTNVVVVNELTYLCGQIAALARDYATAEEALGTAHGADPSNPAFALEFARLLTGLERFDEVREVIDQALGLPPRPGRAPEHFRLKLQQLREKVEHLEKIRATIERQDERTSRGPAINSSDTSTTTGRGTTTSTHDRADGL